MLSNVRVFPPFFPTENMWHQSFLLARFSRFNPSCECRKEKKKDGSVSEEAHSSWGSLITVVVERETEDERPERWSAADMAGISRQRWDESTYSGYALLLIRGCDITSCSTPKGSESVKQESQSKWRGSEGIVLRPTKNVWIRHQNAARPAVPRGPEYLMKTTESLDHENVQTSVVKSAYWGLMLHRYRCKIPGSEYLKNQ